ncbi:FAD-dependent oxidoreductase [Microvirga makkahensis]|uniref:FAD-dependent oxidoreductase n=1 Tax=Microvirga makkahensis TaxID=1128670 RepID=UPI001FED1554|nr:FAD-dependent oxidoreductase [Microvirga makkahensis]
MDEIRQETEAARIPDPEAQALDRPLPFPTAGALCFHDQAPFNPARYLMALAKAVEARGSRIFEQSRATSFDQDDRWRVGTRHGTIRAAWVVTATSMTVKSPVGDANRTQPRSHVAMALRLEDPGAVDGMFIGIDDPTHSIRTGRDEDGPLLITLGPASTWARMVMSSGLPWAGALDPDELSPPGGGSWSRA